MSELLVELHGLIHKLADFLLKTNNVPDIFLVFFIQSCELISKILTPPF